MALFGLGCGVGRRCFLSLGFGAFGTWGCHVPRVQALRQGGATCRGGRFWQFECAFLAACAQRDRTAHKGKRPD